MTTTADKLMDNRRNLLGRGVPLMDNEPQTLPQLFRRSVTEYDLPDALNYKDGDVWRPISSVKMVERAENIALGLYSLGLRKGDRAAILAPNSPEWTLSDAGCQFAGVVDVPIYTTLSPDTVRYIIDDSAARIFFLKDADTYQRLLPALSNCVSIDKFILFDGGVEADNVVSLESLELAGTTLRETQSSLLQELSNALDPQDIATLIYTSGTTGGPKGVMLTHANLISNVIDASEKYLFTGVDISLSVLPLSHVFERTGMYVYLMFVVHPQLGKWLISSGEAVFGMNAFGWRIAACVFGSLLIVATVRLARRVSRSTLIGGIAGVLLCADGLEFTMSRIALLDIFQAFFLVAAVGAVVADRDYFRWKLADKMTALGLTQLNGRYGPIVWLRPWRLVAGVLFGLAIGVKWNSMFVLAAMGVLSVIWDIGARRLAGADFRAALGLLIEGIPAFLRLVVVAALVYVATWASWWATAGGWDRRWGLDHPESPWTKWLGPDIASFMFLHQEIYGFHTGDYINHATHPYAATPAGWLLMLRPIAIDYQGDIKPGVDGCTATDSCVRAVTGMGTPILWWMAAAALIVGLVWWIGGRDWRFGLPIVAALSTYLPWFNYDTRPLFFFYAITIVPFTATILAMCFGLLLGAPGSPGRWRGGVVVGVATALVWGDFAYIYPVLSGELIPYQSWLQRMWLRSWI